MCKSCNFCVLFCCTFSCIYHNNTNIRPFNCKFCPYNTIFFNFFIYFTFPSNSCSIYKIISTVFIFDNCINCIPCCTCNIRNYASFLSGNIIYKRRFADIRFSDNCHLYAVWVFFSFIFWQISKYFIKKISRPMAMHRRNFYRITKPKIIKFIKIIIFCSNIIKFINTQNNRFTGFHKH